MRGDRVIHFDQPLDFPEGVLCGVDEAGRGPIAGPVTAAAVILPPALHIDGLDDSKKLSPRQRESLAVVIRCQALAWSVGWASVEEIDRLNILQATFLAMQRAVQGLAIHADFALIDGNHCPALPMPAIGVVKGDARVPAISAASILAKTDRDAFMESVARDYPHYHFEQHKGYPTPLHLECLKAHGPCACHRKSFEPVSRLA
jgi:ribonuclease HII